MHASKPYFLLLLRYLKTRAVKAPPSLLIVVIILQFKTMMHIIKSPGVDILNGTHSISTFTFFVLTKVEVTSG